MQRKIEDFVLGLLFFALALLFSTRIEAAFTLPKLLAFRLGTVLLALLWTYRVSRGEIRSIPRPVFYSVVALAVWWAISTLFAAHLPTALNGYHGRYNGLWTHELYILLFLILASLPAGVRRVETLLKLFVSAQVPVSVYALLQFQNVDFIRWVGYEGRPASTIGNPVILAALLGLASPFALTFLFREKSKFERSCWGLVFLVLMLAMIGTASRGPLISAAISSAVVLFFNSKEVRIGIRTWILALSLFLLALLAFVYSSQGGIKRFTERPDLRRALELRFVYYKAALDIVRDHPFTGIGFENFRNLYPRYRPAEENRLITHTVPTMAHNGYLESAVTNGIPALVIYLIFVFSVLLRIVKAQRQSSDRNDRLLLIPLFASLAGFLIQDFTGWQEISLTSSFWILLGLSVSFCGIPGPGRSTREANRGTYLAYSSLCAIAAAVLLVGPIREIQADNLFWKWKQVPAEKLGGEMESEIRRGLRMMENDFYYEASAGILYARRFYQTGEAEVYRKGCELLESAHLHNPYDPDILIHRLEIEAEALKRGLMATPSETAERAANLVIAIDKRNPAVYEAVAKLRLAEGRTTEAVRVMEIRGQATRSPISGVPTNER